MSTQPVPTEIDPKRFRQVLGHYPTGVTVVTAVPPDGQPVGMAIGSFTSVSLDPPLVAFLPDHSSTSWPQIREAGAFCVNVLSADQESVCRIFASKATDKFDRVPWSPAATGSPILDGVVAWIDCDIEVVHPAGDHDIVIGRVRDLTIVDEKLPLVFFQGGYGRFAPRSLAVVDDDLMSYLRISDLARPEIEAIAADLDCEVTASAVVGEEIVLLAAAGPPRTSDAPPRVGQRLPYAPPLGAVFAAWSDDATVGWWLQQCPPETSESSLAVLRRVLADVRARGWSAGLALPPHRLLEQALAEMATKGGGAELRTSVRRLVAEMTVHEYHPSLEPGQRYHLSNIAAPVFGFTGRVVLALTLVGLPEHMTADDVERHARRLLDGAATVTRLVTG